MTQHEVTTPVPGMFYRRPDPDSPPFVEVGDAVEAGQVIGLVEIMKNYVELVCDLKGTVVRLLVDDEDIVGGADPIVLIEVDR